MPNERLRELVATAARLRGDGQWAEAIVAVESWLQLAPHDPNALFVLGLLRIRTGETAAAGEALRRALHQRPDHAAAEALLRRLGEPPAAAARRREAAAVLLAEVDAERADGHLADAQRRAKAALQACPDDPAVHALVGELALAADEPSAARRHLEQALALDPHLPGGAELLDRAVLADEPWVDPYVRLTVWRRQAWQLALEDWPAWAVFDALAGLLMLLPPGLAVGLPLAQAGRRGLSFVAADLSSQAPALLLLALAVSLAVGAWLFASGGGLLCGRLLLMAHKVTTGEFAGSLVQHGLPLFRRTWRQLVLLWLTLHGLLLAGAAGGPVAGVLLFLAPVLVFSLPLVVLGGRDAWLACSESYHSTRAEWSVWLGLLLSTALLPALLALMAVVVPVWLVVQSAGRGPTWIGAGVCAAAALWMVLSALAWLTWHGGAMAWLVAYRERFGASGLREATAHDS